MGWISWSFLKDVYSFLKKENEERKNRKQRKRLLSSSFYDLVKESGLTRKLEILELHSDGGLIKWREFNTGIEGKGSGVNEGYRFIVPPFYVITNPHSIIEVRKNNTQLSSCNIYFPDGCSEDVVNKIKKWVYG